MKSLFAAIFLATTLGSAPVAQQPAVHQHEHCCHTVVQVEEDYLSRATLWRAVCSKGDLNATFQNRGDAVKTAQSHQKATGHKTSVTKQ